MERIQSVKFYLSDKSKTNEIISFLKECQTVENQLITYYWEHFDTIIESHTQIDIRNNNKINFQDTTPILKSHHFYATLDQCFWTLKSIENKIIKSMCFKFENNVFKQRLYNYCKGFCFQWNKLIKAINREQKSDKKNTFLIQVKEYLSNESNFESMKTEIEQEFWNRKDKITMPVKSELQIWVSLFHTVDIEKSNKNWLFIIDNNEKNGVKLYKHMYISTLFSNYHKSVLEGKDIKNTINLKLNHYGKIEITVAYNIEVEKPVNNVIKEIGIDIGLKKLIVTSEGEVVEQNDKLIYKAQRIQNKISNRQRLEAHMQKKNPNFVLGSKRFNKQNQRLIDFVKCDNRAKVKKFLLNHLDTHIVMEDLKIGYGKTYSKQVNYLLRRLHTQMIKDDLIKYADSMGIENSIVNPAFTSQECSDCGYTDKKNRIDQEHFHCIKCGHEENADVNASKNIRQRYHNPKIKLTTPFWRVKELLLCS